MVPQRKKTLGIHSHITRTLSFRGKHNSFQKMPLENPLISFHFPASLGKAWRETRKFEGSLKIDCAVARHQKGIKSFYRTESRPTAFRAAFRRQQILTREAEFSVHRTFTTFLCSAFSQEKSVAGF